jgi:hypothetical protein
MEPVFSDEDLQRLWSDDSKEWITKPSIILTDTVLREILIWKHTYAEFEYVYQILTDLPGTCIRGESESKQIVIYMNTPGEEPYFIVTNLVDGRLSGNWCEYFLNDQLRKRRYFDPKTGALSGSYEVFWYNGNLQYYSEVIHGVVHGPLVNCDKDGDIVRFRKFEYGQVIYDSETDPYFHNDLRES